MIRLILLLFVLLSSFITIYNTKDFTYYKNSNVSTLNKLEIAGYYFRLDSAFIRYNYHRKQNQVSQSYDSALVYHISTIILYNDGRAFVNHNTTWTGLTFDFDSLTGENTYDASHKAFQGYIKEVDNENYKNKKSGIWNWGAFRYDGDTLKIQYFYNKIGNYELREFQGLIENKTSFKLFYEKIYNPNPQKSVVKKIDYDYMFFLLKKSQIQQIII